MWMYGGSCSKLVQVVSYGQGHHRCTIYLYFLLRFNSQPRKNMLGYPPRLTVRPTRRCAATRRCISTVRDGRCHFMAPCYPLPSIPHIAPLERRRRRPRKAYDHRPSIDPGRHRDMRMMKRVSSATIGSARPSPPLWEPKLMGRRHAGRCAIQEPPSARPSSWRMDGDQARTPA
jgi:hypothetical protein